MDSLNPADAPDAEFTYCDISAIDNEAGVVSAPKVLMGRDAPSRARQAVRPGDVLFSTVRPGLRAIARVPAAPNPVASTGFCVLRPAEGVDGSLLLQLLRSHDFLQQVLPFQRGVSYPAVRDADVLSQLVPIPPAAEQSRIVEKLDELLSDLDAGVAELKAAQKKLQQYRQSLLKAAVEGSLTAAWREANPQPEETGADLLARILRERRARWESRQLAKFEAQGKAPPKGWQGKYSEPVAPSVAGMPRLPECWVWASLSQLLESLHSGSAETSGRDVTAFPVLKSSAVRQGHIDFDALNYLTEVQSRPENLLSDGDLLITRLSGSVEYVGCAAVVRQPPAGGVQYPDRIFCGKLLPLLAYMADFLVHCLGSGYARTRLEAAAKSTAGHKRISLSDLLPFPIPLPPRSELALISQTVDAALTRCSDLTSAIQKALAQSTAQRQNLLRAAFAGQLVPQDPADEPAAALLARIRAKREATAPRRARLSKASA